MTPDTDALAVAVCRVVKREMRNPTGHVAPKE